MPRAPTMRRPRSSDRAEGWRSPFGVEAPAPFSAWSGALRSSSAGFLAEAASRSEERLELSVSWGRSARVGRLRRRGLGRRRAVAGRTGRGRAAPVAPARLTLRRGGRCRLLSRLAAERFLSRLRGVVGHVPSAALEDEGRGGEQPANGAPASIAGRESWLRDSLPHFEDAGTARTFILVGRHVGQEYHDGNDRVKPRTWRRPPRGGAAGGGVRLRAGSGGETTSGARHVRARARSSERATDFTGAQLASGGGAPRSGVGALPKQHRRHLSALSRQTRGGTAGIREGASHRSWLRRSSGECGRCAGATRPMVGGGVSVPASA